MVNPEVQILFIDQTGKLGGAELCLLDIARHFRERAEVVLLENGPFADRLRDSGVAVEVLPLVPQMKDFGKDSGILTSLRMIPTVLKAAIALRKRARNADVLYANTLKALVLAALASFFPRRPLVFHLHDILSAEHFSRFNRWLIVKFANVFASEVIANSKASLEAFIASGGKAKRTTVIYNGFDVSTFSSSVQPDASCENESPLVVIVGRFSHWKGQDVVMEAVARLPGVHLRLVGDALFTGEDNDFAESLRLRAQQPDLNGRVEFTGFTDDVIKHYGDADVVVHASRQPEPFGRVIVEAMLCGKPVIATRQGGAMEIINDGADGLLVSPDDPTVLANAIEELISDPVRANKMGVCARESASRRFGLESVLEQTSAIIERAAAS